MSVISNILEISMLIDKDHLVLGMDVEGREEFDSTL
jgi:hypothetical protein